MNEFDNNQYNGDPEHDMWVDYDYEINTDEDVTDDAFENFDDEDNIPENENIGNPNEIITNRIVLGIVLLCHPRYNHFIAFTKNEKSSPFPRRAILLQSITKLEWLSEKTYTVYRLQN